MKYNDLRRPVGAPPSNVFGILWAAIYICYAALGVILLSQFSRVSFLVWALYSAGWVVNLLWIPLFRSKITTVWNGAYITVLLYLILSLSGSLWADGNALIRGAALLLIPYIVWLCVAIPLSFSLVVLN